MTPTILYASSETQLNNDIASVDAAALGSYTILLTGTINETTDLSLITLAPGVSLTIDGNGNTLDGAGTYRGFYVYAGDVTIRNLTIADAAAIGGAGGAGGGGGGAGLGGGLFVASAATVSVDGVSFLDDSATGGAGGASAATGSAEDGGGGGLGGAGGGGGGAGGGGGGGITNGFTGAPGPSGVGGTGGGLGGVAGNATTGGAGGLGGGGGGGAQQGGIGGFGGGGGAGQRGGTGGFGGGGGGATASSGGAGGGYGAGWGSTKSGSGTQSGGGGGGLGAGGDIFVQQGGSLIVEGGTLSGGEAVGGTGSDGGSDGQGIGGGVFIQTTAQDGGGTLQSITFAPGRGEVLTIDDPIVDQGEGGTNHPWSGGGYGAGGLIVKGGGTVELTSPQNAFAGGVTIEGATTLRVEAGSIGPGDTTVEARSTLDIGGGASAGDVTLGGGSTLDIDNGSAGAVTLGGGSTLDLATGSVGAITLAGADTLQFDGTTLDAGAIASIAGYGTADVLHITNIGTSGIAVSGFDGNGTVNGIGLSGVFAALQVTPDGAGGSYITPQSTFAVGNEAELNQALAAIDGMTSGSYTIQFTGNITEGTDGGSPIIFDGQTLTAPSDLYAIDLASGVRLTIDGGSDTLDGMGLYRGLLVYAGNVAIQNLAIADAAAVGGAGGTYGGGGGAGLGGGLFVASGGTVTVNNVAFLDDKAKGGAGGLGAKATLSGSYTLTAAGNYMNWDFGSITGGDGGGGGGMGGAGGPGSFELGGGGGGGIGNGAVGATPSIPPVGGIVLGAAGAGTGDGLAWLREGAAAGGGGGAGAAGQGSNGPLGAGGGGVGGNGWQSFYQYYVGGTGGFGGGGGSGLTGGAGGFGGGGGAAAFGSLGKTGAAGGAGGFGGGGGGGGWYFDVQSPDSSFRNLTGPYGQGGPGGFGGGNAGAWEGGGGGGLGAGGDIFVQQGGSLIVEGGTLSGGSATGGAGGAKGTGVSAGSAGQGYGPGLFIQSDSGTLQDLTFAPPGGETLTIATSITDEQGAAGTGGQGGLIIAGGGTVLLTSQDNDFTGGATIEAGSTLEIASGAFPGSDAITFAGAGTLLWDGTSFGPGSVASISGFVGGLDTLDLPNAGGITLINGAPGTATVDGVTVTGGFQDLQVTGGDVICFAPGTRIATPGGERAVETLAAGDLVLTVEGEAKPVAWLGRQTVSRRFADPLRVMPIRIMAGALGDNVPLRDLRLSPDHALLVDGVLIQAGALVNGTSIIRESGGPERFTYYHVELADHALILAEGAPAETFIDNVDRLAFDNWEEHLALYPEGKEMEELPQPRAKSHRQVPPSIRARLLRRATLAMPRSAA